MTVAGGCVGRETGGECRGVGGGVCMWGGRNVQPRQSCAALREKVKQRDLAGGTRREQWRALKLVCGKTRH